MPRKRDIRLCGNEECDNHATEEYVADGIGYCSRMCLEDSVRRSCRECNRKPKTIGAEGRKWLEGTESE